MSSDHFPDTLKKALRWEFHYARAIFLSGLIVAIGCCASAAFWTIGIKGAKQDQELQFVKQADELITAIQTTWQEFSVVGLWMQEECHGHEDSEFLKWTSCSREDFAELYEFVSSSGLDFQAILWIPKVTNEERPSVEDDAANYYSEFLPDLYYRGIQEYGWDPAKNRTTLIPRRESPFYFPIHYILPLEGGNIFFLDYDMYAIEEQARELDQALTTMKPTMTGRFRLGESSYALIYIHPGIKRAGSNETSNALSAIVVAVSEILKRAMRTQNENLGVYVYDETYHDGNQPQESYFLGGAQYVHHDGDSQMKFVDEVDIKTARTSAKRIREVSVPVEDRIWRIIVTDPKNVYEPELAFVILAGTVILVACLMLAIWFYTSINRAAKIQEITLASEAEKAALVVENAKAAAAAEREINDYIAHVSENATWTMKRCVGDVDLTFLFDCFVHLAGSSQSLVGRNVSMQVSSITQVLPSSD